jgi:hypothetical protein
VQGEDERLARERGDGAGEQPVGVDDVDVRTPHRSNRAEQETRQQPWPPAELGRDRPLSRQLRADDGDVDARGTKALDGIGDEPARDVVLVGGIRGRQDRDAQGSLPPGPRPAGTPALDEDAHSRDIGRCPVAL